MISRSDRDAVEILREDGSFPCLVVCDHASNAIPSEYGDLGVDPVAREDHVAWDLGVADVVRRLSQRLDAPAVLSRWSRLFVDVNRWIRDPRLILPTSDGVAVPGNAGVDEAETERRLAATYWPYHRAVGDLFERLRRRRPDMVFLSLHSCTGRLAVGGEPRPWHAGTFWHESRGLSDALLAELGRDATLRLAGNRPYSGVGGTFTLDFHTWGTGVPGCGLEIINDHLRTAGDRERWADRLAAALTAIAAAGRIDPASRAVGADA